MECGPVPQLFFSTQEVPRNRSYHHRQTEKLLFIVLLFIATFFCLHQKWAHFFQEGCWNPAIW